MPSKCGFLSELEEKLFLFIYILNTFRFLSISVMIICGSSQSHYIFRTGNDYPRTHTNTDTHTKPESREMKSERQKHVFREYAKYDTVKSYIAKDKNVASIFLIPSITHISLSLSADCQLMAYFWLLISFPSFSKMYYCEISLLKFS